MSDDPSVGGREGNVTILCWMGEHAIYQHIPPSTGMGWLGLGWRIDRWYVSEGEVRKVTATGERNTPRLLHERGGGRGYRVAAGGRHDVRGESEERQGCSTLVTG